MKGESLMMHSWTRATLTAVMLSTVAGCSSMTATTLLSNIDTRGLSKAEIHEQFGSPTSSGVTSLGRQTQTYRIQTGSEGFGAWTPSERLGAWFVALIPSPPTAAGLLLLPVLEIQRALGKFDIVSDIVFVYGEDDRVLYSYNTKADPSTRYSQALSSTNHPLDNIEDAKCPKLKACVEGYVEEARQRAQEVGYQLTPEEEKSFQLDLEIAQDVDNGKITKEEALRRRWSPTIAEGSYEVSQHCGAGGDGKQRKISPELYDAVSKLTDRLLDGMKDNDGSMSDAVAAYIEEFRKLTTGFNHRLTCSDEVTFQLEAATAKDADEGKLTREEGISKLRAITTRHLINLYYGRS